MMDWGGAKGMTGEEERRCLDLFLIFLFVYLLKKEKVTKSSDKDDMKEKQQKQESL